MSDYTRIHDFSAKDALSSGDPNKLIKGSEVDAEFDDIVTHMATKFDSSDIATQVQAEAESLNTVLMTPQRVGEWADANAGMVGDLQALADPNADRILFWDDSAGAAALLTVSTGLSLSGTSLTTDDSAIDHDALTNFVANEHIDWTTNSGSTIDDNNLSANVPLLDAANAFSASSVRASAALQVDTNQHAAIYLKAGGATTDEKSWDLQALSTSTLRWATATDADGAGEVFFQVDRTGTTVDSVSFPNGAVSITDGLAIGGGQSITDSDNIPLLNASNRFTASGAGEGSAAIDLEANNVAIRFAETDQTSGNNAWYLAAVAGQFTFSTATDAGAFNSGENVLEVNRTGTTVDTINFANGELQYGGTEVGFREAPSRDVSSAGNTAASDSGKTIRFTGNGFTFTLDSDPPEDAVVVLDNAGGGSVTIAASTTLIWAQDASTGTRTLADDGLATALHRGSGTWIISGAGLS